MIKCGNLSIFFISAILFLSSCQKTDVSNDNTDTGVSSVNKTVLLQLVNDTRQRGCNCGPTYMPPVGVVIWNNQLGTSAQMHSNDMLTNNYFSHTGLDGSSPGDRIRLAGYNWRKYGENIAKGYSSEQEVINAWILSEDHCRNIMDPDFREMGVARAGVYWTQEFGLK
jgi:uncharacterized protein YkwD